MFSNAELADIHYVYGYCDGNAREAQREYQRRFPNRRLPDRRVFSRSHQRLSEYGSFAYHHEGGGRLPGREGNVFVICNLVHLNL